MVEIVIDVPERLDEFMEDLDELYGETKEDRILYALKQFIDRDPPPYRDENNIVENPVEVG